MQNRKNALVPVNVCSKCKNYCFARKAIDRASYERVHRLLVNVL